MAYDGMGYRSVEDCEAEIRRLRERLAKVEANAVREMRLLQDQLDAAEWLIETDRRVKLFALRSKDTKRAVLQKALTLYGLGLDAREKGNRLAILGPDDTIIREIVGFEPAEANGG